MLVPIDKNISVSSDLILMFMAIKYDPDEFMMISVKISNEIFAKYISKIACMSREDALDFVNKKCYEKYWELLLKGEDYDTD